MSVVERFLKYVIYETQSDPVSGKCPSSEGQLTFARLLDAEVKPSINPIRGGTGGARLSYMGLPAPNLFSGGHNFHGRYEFIPVNSMEKAVQVIVRIAELCTKI